MCKAWTCCFLNQQYHTLCAPWSSQNFVRGALLRKETFSMFLETGERLYRQKRANFVIFVILNEIAVNCQTAAAARNEPNALPSHGE